MLLLAAGLTQDVTTIAQEAAAAVTAVTLLPAPAQGTGAASLPQETSGEDTQMLSAPGATHMLTAAGTSTVRTPGVEGRVQTWRVLSHKDPDLLFFPCLLAWAAAALCPCHVKMCQQVIIFVPSKNKVAIPNKTTT